MKGCCRTVSIGILNFCLAVCFVFVNLVEAKALVLLHLAAVVRSKSRNGLFMVCF